MAPEQTISENLWWVIPELMAGVRTPLENELSELESLGIGAIVSVRDDPTNIELYEQKEISHLWVPTKGGTPPTYEQLQQFFDFVKRQQEQSRGVAVHCSSGKRRTCTMIAAYLICIQGHSYEEALSIISQSNPQADPRDAQKDFLKTLSKS